DEGAVVPVFTNFFVVGEAGENVDAFRPGSAAGASVAVGTPAATAVVVALEVEQPRTEPGARMSPRARKFAEVHNFHPASVRGSGPGGRILEEDLRKLYEARPKTKGGSHVRATIARRMRESLASTAQYTLNSSADAAGLLILRARMKASAGAADVN